jgi:hypothetical protein
VFLVSVLFGSTFCLCVVRIGSLLGRWAWPAFGVFLFRFLKLVLAVLVSFCCFLFW